MMAFRSDLPMTGALRFKGAFIDQEVSCNDMDANMGRQRSSSAPPSSRTWSQEFGTEDFFAEEKALVSELSEYYNGPFSPPSPISISEDFFPLSEDSADDFEASDAVTASNAATSAILLRAKGCGGDMKRQKDEETVASVCTTLPSVESSEVSTSSSSAFSRACNLGSIGHPELCSRPCLHFAVGRCANGTECQFCHMPHDNQKKGIHLPKKQRALVERLPKDEAVAIVWPILAEKVVSFDRSQAASDALAAVAAVVGVPSDVFSGRAAAGVGTSLQRALRGMNLRRVLLTLEPAAKSPPNFPAASEALLATLREAALARV